MVRNKTVKKDLYNNNPEPFKIKYELWHIKDQGISDLFKGAYL